MKATCKCRAVLRVPEDAEGVISLHCPVCSRRLRVHVPSRQAVRAGAGQRPDRPGQPDPANVAAAPQSSEPADQPVSDDPLEALAYSVEQSPAESRSLRPRKRTISVADAQKRDRRRAERFEKRLTLAAVVLSVGALLSAVIPLPTANPFGSEVRFLWPMSMSIERMIWPLWLYWLAGGASLAAALSARRLARGGALLGIWAGVQVAVTLFLVVAGRFEGVFGGGEVAMVLTAVTATAALTVLVVAHVRMQVRGGAGLRLVGGVAGLIVAAVGLWRLGLVLMGLHAKAQSGAEFGDISEAVISLVMVGLFALTSAAAGVVCGVNSLLATRRRRLSAVVLCLIYIEVAVVSAGALVLGGMGGSTSLLWVVWGLLLALPGTGLLTAGLVATAVWTIRGSQGHFARGAGRASTYTPVHRA